MKKTSSLAREGAAFLAGTALGAVALVGFSQLTRRPNVSRVDGDMPGIDDPAFESVLRGTLGVSLQECAVEVLTDGDGIFGRMFEEMRRARRCILVHTFYWEPGRSADELKEVLLERVAAGVRVHLLYDWFGAGGQDADYFRELRDGGVEVAALRPPRLGSLHAIEQRSHARIVVIDGEAGYCGGFGFAEQWDGSGRREGEWRETAVRVTGPAIGALSGAFAGLWAEATGALRVLDVPDDTPPADGPPGRDGGASGRVRGAALHSSPSPGSTITERLYTLSIAAARRSIDLAVAYFAPNSAIMEQLEAALARGVRIRVLTADPGSDLKALYWAGRARYERLLETGARIFEYRPSMMHAKTFVVDGRWCYVGAMNLDNQSFAHLEETGMVMLDEGIAGQLTDLFEADLGYSREIELERFRRRSIGSRALEAGADLISPML